MVAVFFKCGIETLTMNSSFGWIVALVNMRCMLLRDISPRPSPDKREMFPVNTNSKASTTPLFPVPFGPQIEKFLPFNSSVNFLIPRNSSMVMDSILIITRAFPKNGRLERFF